MENGNGELVEISNKKRHFIKNKLNKRGYDYGTSGKSKRFYYRFKQS